MQTVYDEVAFGFSRNLAGFKTTVPQACNYMDMQLDPYASDFSARLLAIMQQAQRIHFDLSGMTFLNTPEGVLHGPVYLSPLGSTNWELRTVWDNPALRGKTTFYRNGKLLSPARVLKLQ